MFISTILSLVATFIINTISAIGYGGIVLLMAIESAAIPLPSEIIMPFSGFLVAQGQFNLWLVGLAGAVGCVLGSVITYWLGYYGGRPLVQRYGKYILISHHDLDLADRWFARYGGATVFWARLLPVVRTYISIPAGISQMPFWRFVGYSFLGSLPWTLLLAWLGIKLGDNWEVLRAWFHRFDLVVGFVIVVAIVWWVWRHVANQKSKIKAKGSPSGKSKLSPKGSPLGRNYYF